LRAAGLIIDQNGLRKRLFDSKKDCIVSYSCKKIKTKTRSKPWWDTECQEAVDF